MDCNGLRTTCRECGRRFKRSERDNPCPDCGEKRNCGKQAVPGYKGCEVHGGPNPSKGYYGPGRGLSTGKGSNFPITKLAAKKNELMQDGRYLSTRNSIDIMQRRIVELVNRIDTNQAPDRLKNLKKLWDERALALKSDPSLVSFIEKKIDAEFEAAYHDYESWKQIFDVLRLDKELKESEVKIAKELQAMITAEDAYALIGDILAVILSIEEDPMKLKRYQYELTRLIGEKPSR